MSKKIKKRRSAMNYQPRSDKRRYGYVWLGGAAAVIAAVLGVVLFTRGDGIPGDFVPEVIGAPRVAVAQEAFDYGEVKLNTTIETVFEVQNVGDENLRIIENPQVQVLEGC